MKMIIITVVIMMMPHVCTLFEEIAEFKKTCRKPVLCRISIRQSPYLVKIDTLPSKIAFFFSLFKSKSFEKAVSFPSKFVICHLCLRADSDV